MIQLKSAPVAPVAGRSGRASPAEEVPASGVGRAVAPDVLAMNYRAMGRFLRVTGVLCLLYLSGYFLSGEDWRQFVNRMGPATLFVVSLWTAFDIVRANSRTLWTPIPWFVTSSGAFFGFGALAYEFGSEKMIARMDDMHPVIPDEIWRTNLLNTVGIFVITAFFLASSRLADRHARRHIAKPSPRINQVRAEAATYVFLSVGLPLQYFLILPYEFGRLSFVLPGVLMSLCNLVSLGVFMLAYLASKSGGRWGHLFWLVFFAELFVDLLRFNKEAFVMTLVMAVLGRYLARGKIIDLFYGAALSFVAYVLLVPLVTWGREEVILLHGDYYHASFGERLDIVHRGLDQWSSGEMEFSQEGSWWTRLCYTNVEALAMYLYDRERPGDSFELCVYGLVPRFLWPDKPVLEPGADFTEIAVGNRESHTGIGIFGESYWNGGWALLLATCAYVGVLFTWLSRMALGALVRSEWLLLPCAFMGVRLGAHIDDWFATGYLNGVVIYLLYYGLIRLVMGHTRPGMTDAGSGGP